MITRFVHALSALSILIVSGCANNIEYVKKVTPDHFQENAVLVGSIVTPDDGVVDILHVRGLDDGANYRVTGREQIREDNDYYQVGMFALIVPPGRYSFFTANYYSADRTGGETMTWSHPAPLLDREVKAGEFIYIGRAICRTTNPGCRWSMSNESARDLRVLKLLNPRLPWEKLEER